MIQSCLPSIPSRNRSPQACAFLNSSRCCCSSSKLSQSSKSATTQDLSDFSCSLYPDIQKQIVIAQHV